jgi:hypothetical protein
MESHTPQQYDAEDDTLNRISLSKDDRRIRAADESWVEDGGRQRVSESNVKIQVRPQSEERLIIF